MLRPESHFTDEETACERSLLADSFTSEQKENHNEIKNPKMTRMY